MNEIYSAAKVQALASVVNSVDTSHYLDTSSERHAVRCLLRLGCSCLLLPARHTGILPLPTHNQALQHIPYPAGRNHHVLPQSTPWHGWEQ
jgi:hypothetical protein